MRTLIAGTPARQAAPSLAAWDGILYELAIIGEAAGRVSDGFRSAHPEVPWRQIIAQRNILVPVYDQLNIDRSGWRWRRSRSSSVR